jgi:AhpD family alkylhydroperoxidase
MSAFPGRLRRPDAPRIRPGRTQEIGRVNAGICAVIALGARTPGRPPRVFTTLARHRGLFRAWLRFAGRLMPRGKLPRTDTELVILRVSVNTGCDYEWGHHTVIGERTGLTPAQIARVGEGPDAEGWSEHERSVLRAVDELAADDFVSDATWAALSTRYDERQLIELCMLAGHYTMLAGALNSLGVQPD